MNGRAVSGVRAGRGIWLGLLIRSGFPLGPFAVGPGDEFDQGRSVGRERHGRVGAGDDDDVVGGGRFYALRSGEVVALVAERFTDEPFDPTPGDGVADAFADRQAEPVFGEVVGPREDEERAVCLADLGVVDGAVVGVLREAVACAVGERRVLGHRVTIAGLAWSHRFRVG